MVHGHPITLAHGQRNPVQMAMEHIAWHALLSSLENKGDFRKFWSGIHTGYQKAKILPSPPSLRSLYLDQAPPPPLTAQASITEIDQLEDPVPVATKVELDSLRAQIARFAAEREQLMAKQTAELAAAQQKATEDAKAFVEEAVRKASLEISEKAANDVKLEKKRAKKALKIAQEVTANAEQAFMQKTIDALNLDDDGLEPTSGSSFGSFIQGLKSRSRSMSLTPSERARSLTPAIHSNQPLQSSSGLSGMARFRISQLRSVSRPTQGTFITTFAE